LLYVRSNPIYPVRSDPIYRYLYAEAANAPEISGRRGEVVGEKDRVLAAVGRCNEMFLDQ